MAEQLTEYVFEKVREWIDSGELRPNERLVEGRIAKRLGASRTPVHVALKQLELMGYTTLLPTGLAVSDYSLDRIQSLWEIREALECEALRLASRRASLEQISKAEQCLVQLVEAARRHDVERFVQAHKAFHQELCHGCQNQALLSLIRFFRYPYQDRRMAHVFTVADWRTQIARHTRILEAVQARDEIRAEKAVRRHYLNLGNLLLRLM